MHCFNSLLVAHNAIIQSIPSLSILTWLKRIHFRSICIKIVVSGRRLIPKNDFSVLLIGSWSSFIKTKEFFLGISRSLFIICLTHIFDFACWSFFISCDRRFSTTVSLDISHGWVQQVILCSNQILEVFVVFEYFVWFFSFSVNAFFHDVADVSHLDISISLWENSSRIVSTSQTNSNAWRSSKLFSALIIFNHFFNFIRTYILVAREAINIWNFSFSDQCISRYKSHWITRKHSCPFWFINLLEFLHEIFVIDSLLIVQVKQLLHNEHIGLFNLVYFVAMFLFHLFWNLIWHEFHLLFYSFVNFLKNMRF